MPRWFSRRMAASLLAAALAQAPRPALAMGPVYCTNCSTIWTQLVQNARQAQQYLTQIAQYQNQLRQYAMMVTNSVALPQQLWANAQSDIMSVRDLANGASLLSGNSRTLIGRLQDANSYLNDAPNFAGMSEDLQTDQTTIGNSLDNLSQVLGLQQHQEESNAALLAALQRQSQSAGGQMQAIEAGNELAGQTNAQLLQIQATLSETAQTEGTALAVDANRRAQEDAATRQFFAAPSLNTSGNPTY